MFKETTIAFSGHNIKWYAVLAVESFLLLYPDMRKNIVWFDDESTDGTKDELEKRGIKVITWSESAKKAFADMAGTGIFTDHTQKLSTRVCYIMRDIMEQVETKYIMFNDGDVAFKKGGFLEEYFECIKQGYKIVADKEFSNYPAFHHDRIKNCKKFDYYCRFVQDSPYNEGYFVSPRVHLLHTFMDLEYFKSINLLGDALEPEVIEVMMGGLVDTGTDFYHKIVDLNIPAKWIDSSKVLDIITHWGWLSSANRDTVKDNANSLRDQEKEIKLKMESEGISEIARKIGVHPLRIAQSLRATKGKSQWL